MRKVVKNQIVEILKTKGYNDAITWYYDNVRHDYIKAPEEDRKTGQEIAG
jgi:hypothetical protein